MTQAVAYGKTIKPSVRKITLREGLGFGIGDFYGGGTLTLIPTYLGLFWTKFCGLDIQSAQGIIGSATFVSAIAALFFGALCDNLYRFPIGRRFGRRRLPLLVTSTLLPVGVLLWIPGQPSWAYFLVFLIWMAISQLFQTAYNSLPSEMTTDYDGRNTLSTCRIFISTAAGTSIPLLGGLVLALLGEDRAVAYQIFTIGFVLLFAVAVFLSWRSTWEMTPEQSGYAGLVGRPGWRVGWRVWVHRLKRIVQDYLSTLSISVFRKHLAIYLLVQVSMDIFGQTFVFYVIYNWQRSAAFASVLLGCSAISLPLMPVFEWAIDRLGPRRLYAIDFAGCLAGVAWLFAAWKLVDVLSSGTWTVFAVAGCLVFFAFKSLCGYVPWAVFAFLPDVDQLVSEHYRSDTFSGVQSCLRQICSGIGTVIAGLVLAWSGFDATLESQPDSALNGLAGMLLGWFALAMILCWMISSTLTIDRRTDGVLLQEITRLRNGGLKQNVKPQTKVTIEHLTGLPYRDVWPDDPTDPQDWGNEDD